MNSQKYHALHYCSHSRGCPIILSGFFNCLEFEWDCYESNPMALEINNEYSLALSGLEMELDELDFDYYQIAETYVSKRFLDVCDSLSVKYRAVPIELSLGVKHRNNNYFIFLPGESLPVLDKVSSVYEVAKDLETGEIIASPLFPGEVSINKIDLFVVSDAIESHLFLCQETLQLFCSDRFKLAAEALKGISFVAIDDAYRYDPWAEFDDL